MKEDTVVSRLFDCLCQVHFVTNEYDGGPIILQRSCAVTADDDAETVASKAILAALTCSHLLRLGCHSVSLSHLLHLFCVPSLMLSTLLPMPLLRARSARTFIPARPGILVSNKCNPVVQVNIEERKAYPEAISLFLAGRLSVKAGIVHIKQSVRAPIDKAQWSLWTYGALVAGFFAIALNMYALDVILKAD